MSLYTVHANVGRDGAGFFMIQIFKVRSGDVEELRRTAQKLGLRFRSERSASYGKFNVTLSLPLAPGTVATPTSKE
ncbi:hypothetical protein A2108_00490 [Candidatus Wolfebacteria bacterium GWA1_42_9]|uniref:Uncharacterized protein n=1 Tax=Candidatus Wolfebacteria bacterium GWA1_42_9 TaxID=1802553 RepID=A0A1F8DNY3_9BACT|nr:MAG: hypothetical protein A2108_00490 [Candidatus Wolfebacteria bacterium GWA1_42_9]